MARRYRNASGGMIIDGIAASEAIDSSGEVLDVKGCDISDLKDGKAVLNWEHRGDDAVGASPLDNVGKIVFAKKIYEAKDCDNDRERMYWKMTKGLPFIYIMARLYDAAGHEGAKAMAAQIRDHVKNNEQVLVRYSIEGSTLKKDGSILKESVARRVAATIKPCNKTCESGIVEDPGSPWKEGERSKDEDLIDSILTRSERANPLLRPLGGSCAVACNPVLDVKKSAEEVLIRMLVLKKLLKTFVREQEHLTSPDEAVGTDELVSNKSVGNGLYHRVFSKENGHFLHVLGGARDPQSGSAASLLLSPIGLRADRGLEADESGRYPAGTLAVARQITHHRVRGQGLGTYLMTLATKYHGQLLSDKTNSAGVERIFDKIGTDKHYRVQLAPRVHKVTDQQYRDPAHAATERHVVEYVGKKPKMKKTLDKSLEGGCASAAPSQLTQGAALQREDMTLRKWKDRAVAKIKAHRGPFVKAEFRAALKAELPEADDRFIDHFADMADDFHVKKSEALIKMAARRKPAATPEGGQVAPEPAAAAPKVEVSRSPMTIRGKEVPANSAISSAHFDEHTGVLHTPRGSFLMYIPGREDPNEGSTFNNILADPKLTSFHDYAMNNWAKVNGLLKAGRLPEEVIMHGTLFSQLSPNTPVPIQELMYGHLVDHMRATGIDARSPNFAATKEGWTARDRRDRLPEHSRDYFEGLGDAVRIGKLVGGAPKGQGSLFPEPARWVGPTSATGRNPGDVQSYMLGNDKFKNMSKYHTLHQALVRMVNHHRDDARSGVQELMQHKMAAARHNAMRNRAIAAGKPDPGPYTAGPDVPGLAPKTSRYMWGMLGGSNVVVPDTHYSRHLFGLEKGKDNDTIDHIKATLWDPNNTHVMNAIDRYYAKHHPAVRHMREHPRFAGLFHDNESAVFPAFWKHWVAISPHEKSRGMQHFAHNLNTDHRPYWEATDPYLMAKNESTMWTVPAQTSATQHRWISEYGEVPALMLYFRYSAPRLLAAAKEREVRSA